MGYTIGMPCLKLNNVGRKSSSCGSFSAVALEALEERQGRDPDIDLNLTPENIYTGYRTAAELLEYSRQHVEELSAKQRAEGGRGIRSDAVVMCATIIKPPAAYMETLSREDQTRLLKDADEILDDLIGGSQNSKSSVIHFDERGGHLHKFWEPMTDDGRLCAKECMSLKFFSALNKQMPRLLRERGWDIDDCNAYDEAKEALKSEQQKYQERRANGRTSIVYKAQAEAEKNRLCAEIDSLQTTVKDLKEKAKTAIEDAEAADDRRKAAEERVKELTRPIQTLEEYNLTADKADDVVTAIEASDRALVGLQAVPELVPFYGRKKAAEAIRDATKGLKKIFSLARELVSLLVGFEVSQKMPKEKRRSSQLDERISAATRIFDRPQQSRGRGETERE